MASLILYVTEHCRLCDDAMDVLLSMPELAGLPLAVLDIAIPGAVSAEDFDRLGPHLPVLAVTSDLPTRLQERLEWPFTARQVAQLLGR